MVDYTSLSIEEPTADQFRDECPDGLNQSEFLGELLDAYEDHAESFGDSPSHALATSEDVDAMSKRLEAVESQLSNVPRDTADYLR